MSVQVEEDFGVSSEVVVLLISLFLLGYVIGPVVFAVCRLPIPIFGRYLAPMKSQN